MSVIIALEQEHGTELDLVPTLLPIAMEGMGSSVRSILLLGLCNAF